MHSGNGYNPNPAALLNQHKDWGHSKFPPAMVGTGRATVRHRDEFATGWAGGTPTTATTHNGATAQQVTATAGGTAYTQKTFTPYWNLRDACLRLWVYVDAANLANMDKLSIFIGENAISLVDYYVEYLNHKFFVAGWNRVTINCNNMLVNGGAPTVAGLSQTGIIRIRVGANPGVDCTAIFGEMEVVPVPRDTGALIISFDDAIDNTFTKAYPIMAPLGLRGVAYCVTTYVGNVGRMTLPQLQTLQSVGWDIASHSYTHTDATTLTDAQIEAEFKKAQDWLASNGFRAYRHHAYPFGNFNASARSIAGKYFETARSTKWDTRQWESFPMADPLLLRSYNVPGNEALATTQANITQAMNSKQLIVLLFHSIKDTIADPSTEYTTADFTTLMAWIAAQGYQVTTLTELTAGLPEIAGQAMARKADLTGDKDVEITDATKGVILKDRGNGGRYRLVMNNGALSVETVT